MDNIEDQKILLNYLKAWTHTRIPCEPLFLCCPQGLIEFDYTLLKRLATPAEYEVIETCMSKAHNLPMLYVASVIFFPEIKMYSFMSQELHFYYTQFRLTSDYVDAFSSKKELDESIAWSFVPLRGA